MYVGSGSNLSRRLAEYKFLPELTRINKFGQLSPINAAILKYGHDKLEIFGDGADQDAKFWMSVIRQVLLAGLLIKDIDNYGLLKLSAKGKEFIKKPKSFMVTQDHDYDSTESDDDDEQGGGFHL